jgi:myo-inositol-1(or 4)-monophosphatase
MPPDLRDLLGFAQELAWEAGRSTLGHFQREVAVDLKDDASPVTVADREAEQIMRRAIAARFPGHDVQGEEFGESGRGSSHRWILDPIDGTRSFIHGVPLYSTLVGLEIDGEMAVGVAYFPALDDMVAAAAGMGCSWNGRPARVSPVARLDEALMVYTDVGEIAAERPGAWDRLQAATRLQRGFADAYGAFMVGCRSSGRRAGRSPTGTAPRRSPEATASAPMAGCWRRCSRCSDPARRTARIRAFEATSDFLDRKLGADLP